MNHIQPDICTIEARNHDGKNKNKKQCMCTNKISGTTVLLDSWALNKHQAGRGYSRRSVQQSLKCRLRDLEFGC